MLTQGQQGAYINLLLWYYENTQPIPVGFEYQASNARTHDDRNNTDTVVKLFFVRDGDVWRNAKCDEVIEDIKKKRETQKANGSKGGRPTKPKDNPTETHGLAKQNPNETQSQSQSQSHINTLSRDDELRRYSFKSPKDKYAPAVDREAMAKELAKATTPEQAIAAIMGKKLWTTLPTPY